MTKKIHLILNEDDVETKNTLSDDVSEPDTTTEKGQTRKEKEVGDTKVAKGKKNAVEPKNTVKITEEQFKEYQKLKRQTMTSDEREKSLNEDIENLNIKLSIYEKTIEEKNLEIENIKAQESIKERVNKLKEEKPYLKEVLEKKHNKGFNSLSEVDEFVSLIDSDTLKNAYDVSRTVSRATKVNNSVVNNVTGITNNNSSNNTEIPVNLAEFGVKRRKKI